jgi:hypothetical protein
MISNGTISVASFVRIGDLIYKFKGGGETKDHKETHNVAIS